LLGEPRRHHPLIGFGRLAIRVERLYGGPRIAPSARRLRGVLAVAVLLVPFTLAASLVAACQGMGMAFSVFALYWALGLRSLHDHARPVAQALSTGEEPKARARVSLMVSRDSAALDITRAATESVLENGNDGVFVALFWFVMVGAPGAVLYRLANTLDAMWGYRTERYLHFGWAAARLDDVLNYLPARLYGPDLRPPRQRSSGLGMLALAGTGLGQPQRRFGDGRGRRRARCRDRRTRTAHGRVA
jgi:adenosylcobinamide-phosphate synthase